MSTMKVSEILGMLVGIITDSNAEAAMIAKDATDITNQFKAGQLSQSEYQELIGDLQTEKLILIQANELTLKEELHDLFSEIMQATSILTAL